MSTLTGRLAYDTPLGLALRRWSLLLLASLAWCMGALPLVLHDRIAGWGGHVEIWIGAVLVAVLGPATAGLLAATSAVRAGADGVGAVARAFGGGARHGARRWRWWLLVVVISAVLAYDVALLGTSGVVVGGAVAAALALALVCVVVARQATTSEQTRLRAILRPALVEVLARPLRSLLVLTAAALVPLIAPLPLLGLPAVLGVLVLTSWVLVRPPSAQDLTDPRSRRGR